MGILLGRARPGFRFQTSGFRTGTGNSLLQRRNVDIARRGIERCRPAENVHALGDVHADPAGSLVRDAERGEHPAIDPGRIDVIGGGALIVDVLGAELRARAGIEEMVVSEHDILDGIAASIA